MLPANDPTPEVREGIQVNYQVPNHLVVHCNLSLKDDVIAVNRISYKSSNPFESVTFAYERLFCSKKSLFVAFIDSSE